MKSILIKFKLLISTAVMFMALILNVHNATGQTTFDQHEIDQEHSAVSGITCIDYDMDDDIDIIACHRVLNQVLLWENNGDAPATWTKKVVTNSITRPLYICSEDINSDDFPDLIISSGGSDAVYCLMNLDGDNNWETFTIDAGFNNAHGVCIADINDDGFADIVATAAADNTIAWWENNGNNPENWTKNIVSNQMYGAQTVAVAHINNDNHLDIIGASSDSNKVVVFFNNGGLSPTFTQQVANQSLLLPHWVSVADVDNDGNHDILVAACASGKVAWLRNDGGNPISWSQKIIGGNFGCALTIEAADLDMDGDMDVAATAFGTNRVAWWEQENQGGQISWIQHTLSYNFKGAWPLVLTDMDADTDTDIIAGGDLLNGLGNESPLSWWENKLFTTSVKKQDINNQDQFQIVPQPATNYVQISYQLTNNSDVSVSIYDPLGKKIKTIINETQQKGKHKIEVDLSSLKYKFRPGIYFCKLVVNKKAYTNKLIIIDYL